MKCSRCDREMVFFGGDDAVRWHRCEPCGVWLWTIPPPKPLPYRVVTPIAVSQVQE